MQYYKEYLDYSLINEITIGKLQYNNEKYYADNINNIEIINNRGIVNDEVIILNNEVINIKKRDNKNIVGILYLDSKIKYGSIKDKSLFLFKPSNSQCKYPNFYIPYKKMNNMSKIYCIIQFKQWTIHDKLPIGTLIETIGNIGDKDVEVEHLRNYYEIKNNTWKINKDQLATDIKNINDIQSIEPDYKVFSIDPIGSKDIDDAFHYKTLNGSIEIGIHIASPNVFFKNNLMEILDRVSTVYTPSRKYNMLPNCYADDILSLLEGKNRYALSLILLFDSEYNVTYEIKETIVNNVKNYTYDNFNKSYYVDFIDFSSKFFKYDLSDTHKLVEYWMIYTNQKIANHLIQNNVENIILRQHISSPKVEFNKELNEYLNMRNENSATYVLYEQPEQNPDQQNQQNQQIQQNQQNQKHSKLGDSYYTHFTSPIRRAVDLYIHNLILNKKDTIIKNITKEQIDKINSFTKRTRKFGNKIKRLNFLYEIKEMEKNIETFGYIIKINKNKICLYIPEYNLEEKVVLIPAKFKDIIDVEYTPDKISYIKDEKLVTYELYQKINIKLWVFTSFENFFDKLKIEII